MSESLSRTHSSQKPKTFTTDEWIRQVRELRLTLEICPADLSARKKMAVLLEELGEWEAALSHWRRVLADDPNNLEAWEGAARCRGAADNQ